MATGIGAGQARTGRAVRTVARNTAFLGVTEVSSKLMSFVFHMVAARHLGVLGFGILNTALAFVSMWTVLTDLGLGGMTAREIAREHGVVRRYVGNILTIKILAAVVVMAIIGLVVQLLRYPAATAQVVYLVGLSVGFTAIVLFYGYVFQGLEQAHWTMVGRILQTLTLLVGAILLARGAPDPARYAVLTIGSWFASAVGMSFIAWRTGVLSGLRVDLRQWGSILRSSLPFGVSVVFSMFYYWNGFTLLSRISGEEAVGVYGAAYRVVMGAVVAGIAFAGALYPQMSRAFTARDSQLESLLGRGFKYMVHGGSALAVVIMILSRQVINLAFGAQYAASGTVLAVLIWWAPLIWMNALLSNFLFAVNREKIVLLQTGASLAVNLGLNLVLISYFGPIGASIALVAAEFVGFCLLMAGQRRAAVAGPLSGLVRTTGKATAAALAASSVGWLVARWSPVAALFSLSAVYLALVLVLRGFDRADLLLVRAIVRRDSID